MTEQRKPAESKNENQCQCSSSGARTIPDYTMYPRDDEIVQLFDEVIQSLSTILKKLEKLEKMEGYES